MKADMRDIKRSNRQNSKQELIPDDLPPDAKKLYEKHSRHRKSSNAKPAVRQGANVPVTSIHVDVPNDQQNSPQIQPVRLGHKEHSIALVFVGILALILVMAGIVFVPRAEVHITIQTSPLLVDETISFSSANTENSIPISVFQKDLQVSGTANVMTKEFIGNKAEGSVDIINRTLQEQKIKAASRLITDDGTLYLMKTHAIVPPAASSTPSRVSISVEAAEPGPNGNNQSGILNFVALDKSSQNLVYAEIVNPLTGGSGSKIAIVRDSDIDNARDESKRQAREQATGSAQKELSAGWAILDESVETNIINFDTDTQNGQESDTISYTTTAHVQGLLYETNVLDQYLIKVLERKLDKDYMLFPGPLSHTISIESIDWEASTATAHVRITHSTIPTLSIESLSSKLAGRSVQQAQEYVSGLTGVQSVTVKTWPFWVKRIPRIEKRTIISIEPERRP